MHFSFSRNLNILNQIVEVSNDLDCGLRLKKSSEMQPIVPQPGIGIQSLPIQVQMATIASLEEWYNFWLDKMPLETNRLMKLKNITELTNCFTDDLKDICAKLRKIFTDNLGMDYSKLAYEIYERQLTIGKKIYIFKLIYATKKIS